MTSATSIHPAVDQGVKPGGAGFRGRDPCVQVQSRRRPSGGQGAMRAQSRLRLLEVLEARGHGVLADRGRVAGERQRDRERA